MTDFGSDAVRQLQAAGSLKWSGLAQGEIGAWVAEMDFGIAPAIEAAMSDAVNRTRFGYPTHDLRDALREITATWYSSISGTAVGPEHVFPVPDVLSALELVAHRATAPGSAIIVPVPAYMPFLKMTDWIGRQIIRVPFVTGADGEPAYDFDAINRAFAQGAGLLVLCNPHNPLGRLLRRSEAEKLSHIVESHGGVVFSDEIHAPLVLSRDVPFVPYASVNAAAAAHTFTAVSASKGWNVAGLKCAQLIVRSERFGALVPRLRFTASTLGMIATVAAYRDSQEWLAGVVDRLRDNAEAFRRFLATEFPESASRVPESTYLAWFDVRSLQPTGRTSEWLRERTGIVATDGADCGADGFVRLNLGTSGVVVADMLDRLASVRGREALTPAP